MYGRIDGIQSGKRKFRIIYFLWPLLLIAYSYYYYYYYYSRLYKTLFLFFSLYFPLLRSPSIVHHFYSLKNKFFFFLLSLNSATKGENLKANDNYLVRLLRYKRIENPPFVFRLEHHEIVAKYTQAHTVVSFF